VTSTHGEGAKRPVSRESIRLYDLMGPRGRQASGKDQDGQNYVTAWFALRPTGDLGADKTVMPPQRATESDTVMRGHGSSRPADTSIIIHA